MSKENPTMEWTEKSGKKCLKFVFGEKLTLQEAEAAITKWRNAFLFKGDEPIVLIWDCKNMKSYDSEAKKKWTETLTDLKSKIDVIWLISDSSLIRMGASIMGMFSSHEIKAVKSESEIVI